MMATIKLKDIIKETHAVQDLLDYVEDDVSMQRTEERRIVTILEVLQEKLCAIDGLQQSLLSELEAKKCPSRAATLARGKKKITQSNCKL